MPNIKENQLDRQREALRAARGAWKPEDHPELEHGAAAWVRQIRNLDQTRFQDLERRRTDK